MCYFLTLGVPAKFAAVMQDAAPRGYALGLVQNRCVLAQLPADFRTFLLTSGMCSCGLYQRKAKRFENPTEYQRRKYREKGWSEARIERAISQAAKHAETAGRNSFVGLHPEAAAIVTDIAERAGRVAVVVHFYNGDLETESFTLRPSRSITGAEFLNSAFPFDEDELIWVTNSTGRANENRLAAV